MCVTVFILLSIFAVTSAQQCTCGSGNIISRIFGGTAVFGNKFPWMAYIEDDTGITQCGGAIINNYYILTAAHCLRNVNSLGVGVGSNYITPSNELLPVSNMIAHENYNRSKSHYNDIALLKLKTPLQFSDNIRPICLPNVNMTTDGPLVVAGWGKTEYSLYSEILRETTIEEYDWDECNRDKKNTLIESQFCAGLFDKDSCTGDSGGPLIKCSRGKSYVVGIVSYGPRLCGITRTAVYTKVSHFLDWIRRNTRDALYCSL